MKMVELLRLAELSARGHHAASSSTTTTSNFVGVVQHITPAKRMRLDRRQVGGAAARVATYFVIHIADPSKSYFKLLCWGDQLPSLTREDHDGASIVLSVGDIVLFSACVIKAYRGNVEAQFTHTSSAQLLYRRERYFNTRDVRLKDLYPMIEWYKSRRHLFLVVAEGSTASSNEGGLSVAFTAVRDVREDMLVNIRGTIEERKGTEDDSVHRGAATDHDGVHLCEVVIKDATGASLLLNLWDQHADPKFVTRFLAHRGPVEAKGVIISFNSATNSLVGDTTPRTEFRFTNAGTADGSPCGSEGSDDADLRNHVFTSIEAIENTSLAGHLHIENVVIDSVLFSDFMGKAGAVTPAYTPLLTECFCSICDCKLPVTHVDSIHRTYGSCPQQCRPKHGESERKWRYRSVTMVLRDTSGSKLSVLVEDTVMTRLLGNIQAESLVNPKTSSGTASLPFNPQTTVAGLVNALVQGTNSGLAMRVELKRVLRKASDTSTGSLNDSVRSDVSGRGEHVEYLAVQMAPIVDTIW